MNDFPSVTPDIGEELFGAGLVGVFYLIYMLIMMAISVGSYVFQSLGYYTIAKRRGIKKPWLSWIPVGNMWILGCISDQYQYVVKGKVKNKRKALLVLGILLYILLAVFIVLYVALIIFILNDDNTLDMAAAGTMFAVLPVSLAMSGISIAISVIQYIALYDLYRSCEPKNSLLYLLLSIFVNMTLPIFVFVCRNKDLGMPPRKPEPARFIPQEPVQQPTWKPVEPWKNTPEE